MNSLYLIEANFGRLGRSFIETDRDTNSRAFALNLIRTGEVNPVKVLEINEDEGTVRDVTGDEDFAEAIVQARLPEIRDAVAAAWDHARDLRKHEVV